MLVACGEAAASFCSSPYAHDGASAKILVEEAGGKVTDWQGQQPTLKTTGLIASNGRLHGQLLKRLKKISA